MYFGNACLFNKKPENMRRIGALGGRARARNLRLRKACPAPVARESPAGLTRKLPPKPSGASMPWLVRRVARDGSRADEGGTGLRADAACKENFAACVKKIMPQCRNRPISNAVDAAPRFLMERTGSSGPYATRAVRAREWSKGGPVRPRRYFW